jgi:hypothetical protein
MDDPQFQQKGFAALTSYRVAMGDVASSHALQPPQGVFPRTYHTAFGMMYWQRGELAFHGQVPGMKKWLGEGEKRTRCLDLVERLRNCGALNAGTMVDTVECHIDDMRKLFLHFFYKSQFENFLS